MKIRYLKDAPLGKCGDIADVQQYEGDVLVKLGFAELFDHSVAGQISADADASDIQILKNLNGTPVVDDFGSHVAAVASDNMNLQLKPKKSSKTKSKGV